MLYEYRATTTDREGRRVSYTGQIEAPDIVAGMGMVRDKYRGDQGNWVRVNSIGLVDPDKPVIERMLKPKIPLD